MYLFPLSVKLSKSVFIRVGTEEETRGQDNQHQQSKAMYHLVPTRRPFGLFFICNFVYFVNNVNIVNVEHFHIWSLYIFCNPLLQDKCLTLYE